MEHQMAVQYMLLYSIQDIYRCTSACKWTLEKGRGLLRNIPQQIMFEMSREWSQESSTVLNSEVVQRVKRRVLRRGLMPPLSMLDTEFYVSYDVILGLSCLRYYLSRSKVVRVLEDLGDAPYRPL